VLSIQFRTVYRTQYSKDRGTLYEMSRPAPGRRPRFNQEQIADIAFGIADREGFDAVSMRRVARELGAGTMTLYHYVRTKDELVSLMDDRLMGHLLVSDEEVARPWREALTAILLRTYRTRLQHPWSLSALQNAGYGRNALRHAEQTLAALDASPFTDDQKATVVSVTDSFVDGHALRAVELLAETSDRAGATAASRIPAEITGGAYPRVQRSWQLRAGWWPDMASVWMDRLFAQGVAALLDGFVVAFAAQS
jgi:AcrR family transcriptional regulator